MAKKKNPLVENGVPHERSSNLSHFKERAGLPSWKELSKDYELGFVESVEKKIALMERYAAANRHLYETLSASGWKVANLLHNIVDLQGKLWELEEKLRAEGRNPLESPEYMHAREQLMKEMQFVHKYKLDVDRFQYQVEEKKRKLGDDDLFKVN